MSSGAGTEKSQPVIFITQTKYPIPSQKFLIPTTWRRYQLSQLVNKALSLPKPVPFDFLVRGEVLRNSLGEWCSEHGVGEEETLEIEYIESVIPPQKMADFPHDDWVSSVLCDVKGYFLTASYDGQIRAFDYSKNLLSSTIAHAAPITSICVIPTQDNEGSTYKIASSSQDLTSQITQVSFGDSTESAPSKALASLILHTAPVSSVSANHNGTHLLTSSWDCLIGVWDTSIPSSHEAPEPALNDRDRKKRRKLEDAGKPKRKAPLSVLKSHTARVSKVVFGSGENTSQQAYSCGFDSTVRVWDVENEICAHTFTTPERPFLDLVVTPDGNSAIATCTDRTMTLFDLRTAEIPSMHSSNSSFLHPATPSCISLGNNPHQVATGAYDGVVRIWDLRSAKGAMATFKAWEGKKKVLSIDWKYGIVGVGGEGGLEIWKYNEDRTSN